MFVILITTPTHHTTGRCSRVVARTPVSWKRFQPLLILPVIENIVTISSFSDVLSAFRWLAMFSSTLILILVFFTPSLDPSQSWAWTLLLSARHDHTTVVYFFDDLTMGSIRCKSSLLSLSSLCIILITLMAAFAKQVGERGA